MGNAGNNISGFLEVDHLVPSSFTGYITQKWTFPNLSFLNFLKKKVGDVKWPIMLINV